MTPFLIPALTLLGALLTDQVNPGPTSALGRFPEYSDRSTEWLKAEYERLEERRAGVGYGPKPERWIPVSVSNPEVIERQTAIRTLLGKQLWQRPYSQAQNTGIPKRKHRELVERAIARGEPVPVEVLREQNQGK